MEQKQRTTPYVVAIGILAVLAGWGVSGLMYRELVTVPSLQRTVNSQQSEIQQLESQVSTLSSQVSTLQTDKTGLEAIIHTQAEDIQTAINQITTLQRERDSQASTIASQASEIEHLNSQVTQWYNSYLEWKNIGELKVEQTLIDRVPINQPARYYSHWSPLTMSYAGYIVVTVHSSTTDNTYVEVVWDAYGCHYDEKITVGSGGTAVFPVLPSTNVDIRVGNTNLVQGASEVVSVVYHY